MRVVGSFPLRVSANSSSGRHCAMRSPSHWGAPLPFVWHRISLEMAKGLGIFTESWKAHTFKGIPKPNRNTQKKELFKYWLRFFSFYISSNCFTYLITCSTYFSQLWANSNSNLSFTPQSQPACWHLSIQRKSQSSPLTHSVYKWGVSNFPLKAHTPEIKKWSKRLPSSHATELNDSVP